ncbi:mitochondrial carrier protein [Cordyceps militaris CM01]|uniref:Mitochondrial carrier protein n=2 Tax=Cordyceps militaris TaxID=73501 RepID=G3JDD1_CORMM|nr:mitochondrial carrier protein [Cordyceps militaris CM01]ATY66644.1 mitochondrial carrier [Cordyceps militaris]EGX92606.1 mitochondrial carrier protein [Cordyceps militaris CM01]
MATNGDVENQRPSADTEETPLLSEDNGNVQGQATDEQAQPWRYLSYSLTALLGLIAIGIIVVFVRGWIDAGSDVNFDFKKALTKALGGGLSGAAAMVLQVLLLMPLRTIMNYQYRYGTSFSAASVTLYSSGGLGRYYDGIGAALIQGPVSRFGDTAANAGILALLQSNSYLKDLPVLIKTIFASLCAAAFRMILTPVDTLKTTLQVQGAGGTALLRGRIRKHGVGTLWWGAFATAGATFVGHYPWFATYNMLSEAIKEPPKEQILLWLLRLAFIGFAASLVSDCVSNSLRVVKTYRQVNETQVSYSKNHSTRSVEVFSDMEPAKAAKLVIEGDGVAGLFGRGLPTRIVCNGLQGLLFSILWKLFLDSLESRKGV